MYMKMIIIITMIVILICLACGLIFLVRDEGKSKRVAKALSWRIGLSIALFAFLFLAFYLELIKPHSL